MAHDEHHVPIDQIRHIERPPRRPRRIIGRPVRNPPRGPSPRHAPSYLHPRINPPVAGRDPLPKSLHSMVSDRNGHSPRGLLVAIRAHSRIEQQPLEAYGRRLPQ